MQNLSFWRRSYYAYLGWAFAFAYQTKWRQLGGYALSSWIKFLALLLLLVVWVMRMGNGAVVTAVLVVIWVYFSYWRAEKRGYNQFVADDTAVSGETAVPGETTVPAEPLERLPAGKRVSLFASGPFAVSDREDTVLLRPAEYWRSAIGEHAVMVTQYPQKYLYQFFHGDTLVSVQPGWLIFGRTPRRTLAITFQQTWGPDHANDVSTYVVGGGAVEAAKRKNRTIYFTFEDTAVENQVWQTLRWSLERGD